MKPDRLLFPIDLAKCPLDALPLLNNPAGRSDASVLLLHDVHLNILAPDNRIYSKRQSPLTPPLAALQSN
ncbi:MAG: hypothetical protein ABSA69_10175 [Verrucomicrobiota bacterium]|jgi:hypothetical protein